MSYPPPKFQPPPPPQPQWKPEQPFATKHRSDKVNSIVKWVVVIGGVCGFLAWQVIGHWHWGL